MKIHNLLLTGLAISFAGQLIAATEVFTDADTFLSRVSDQKLESFETIELNGDFRGDTRVLTDFHLEAGQGGATLDLLAVMTNDYNAFANIAPGAFATEGMAFLAYSSAANELFRFTFNSPQRAFGIHIIDWGDFRDGNLRMEIDATESYPIAATPQADGNVMFFGVATDTEFVTIDLVSTVRGEGYAVDEIYYSENGASQVVPEPSSWGAWILLGAISGFGYSVRRWWRNSPARNRPVKQHHKNSFCTDLVRFVLRVRCIPESGLQQKIREQVILFRTDR